MVKDHRPVALDQFLAARKVVVKIGSSSLTRPDGGLDLNRLDQVAGLLAKYCGSGRKVVLVSSGAIAAGRPFLGFNSRPKDLPSAQACAAMGQGILYTHWRGAFQSYYREIAQVLLTLDDVTRRASYLNVKEALQVLLNRGIVPVVNENDTVATDKIKFGDNDRLAALVAELVNADALVLLTDVPGLFDRPPSEDGAKLIRQINYPVNPANLRLSGTSTTIGTGGMLTKVAAARQATRAGIPVFLTSADQLQALMSGDKVGTYFAPAPARMAARPTWLAHAAPVNGLVEVDQGAARALAAGGKSLLAAGIRQVKGEFHAGDVIEVHYQAQEVARGMVAYDARDLNRISGLRSEEINPEQPDRVRPVIHRDDLVLVSLAKTQFGD